MFRHPDPEPLYIVAQLSTSLLLNLFPVAGNARVRHRRCGIEAIVNGAGVIEVNDPHVMNVHIAPPGNPDTDPGSGNWIRLRIDH